MEVAAPAEARWVDRSAGRWFYASMASACILVCVASFLPSIMGSGQRLGSYTALTMAHGIAFSLWPLVFLAQPLLIQTRRANLHRSLGAAGFLYRRRAAAHKRLMLFATVALLPAPFAHLIGHNPALRSFPPLIVMLIAITLFASAVYDLLRFRRIHPVSLWIGIALFVADNLCATVIGPSAVWRQFVGWLIH